MELTTDFECGGGKRLTQLSEHHWRIEAMGDGSGYDKYFCVQVTAAEDEQPATLTLEVLPDAELGEAGANFFASHFPSNIWYSEGDWAKWQPLRNTWEDAVSFGDARIELRVPVRPGQTLVIATNPPRRYSDMLAWIERQVEAHPGQVERQSLGRSAEGRDIPIVRECDCAADHQRLVVLAGQHPSEHSGNWACEGIVEWLLSPIREAREIGRQFDIAVIPMINPDGNVHGLSGANAEGINLYPDFTGAANGEAPKATENRLLWRWLSEEFQPEVLLHFHGYMGWRRFSTPPGDGMYLLRDAEQLYSPERLAAYRAISARFTFETPALTASWRPGVLGEESLEHNLALRLGTLSAFYEINSAWVGAFEQFRRGPQVLAALARALMLDAPVDV